MTGVAHIVRTERDATNWSSEKLKDLLMGLWVESEEGKCEITEVSKVEGEASINNRKGKLIFFYEWNLKATWTGKKLMQSLLIMSRSSRDKTDTSLIILREKVCFF